MKALILQLASKMPVHQIGKLISVTDNRIWRLLKSYVSLARDAQDMSGVTQFGVDETGVDNCELDEVQSFKWNLGRIELNLPSR